MNEVNAWENLSRKEQLEAIVWDMYKEAHGIRPRHLNLSAMTEAELEAECQRLEEEVQMADRARREAESAAVVRFSQRIEEVIRAGAKNRETALRWIHEADGSNGDDEYLCYINGLPYGFFRAAVGSNWAGIERLITSNLRSGFRKSMRDQVVAWVSDATPKYRSPLSPKQMAYL